MHEPTLLPHESIGLALDWAVLMLRQAQSGRRWSITPSGRHFHPEGVGADGQAASVAISIAVEIRGHGLPGASTATGRLVATPSSPDWSLITAGWLVATPSSPDEWMIEVREASTHSAAVAPRAQQAPLWFPPAASEHGQRPAHLLHAELCHRALAACADGLDAYVDGLDAYAAVNTPRTQRDEAVAALARDLKTWPSLGAVQ